MCRCCENRFDICNTKGVVIVKAANTLDICNTVGGFIVAGKALPSPTEGTDTPPNSSDVASSYSVAGESVRFYIFVPGLLPLREKEKKSHAIIAPVAGRMVGGGGWGVRREERC